MKTIYSIYVRNHTEEGTFKAVLKDLKRIKDLGVDVIWLMPIHPIGQRNKKGSLGCPYSAEDYGLVNPEYGSLSDFKDLVQAIHDLDMEVMIDVVYNHTSYDSKLMKDHADYFYKTESGDFGNRFGDWTDVADLDFDNEGLWDLLIDHLKYWVSQGVDGFRCDVAPLVPLEFWVKAKEEVAKVKENVLWLAESVHPSFRDFMKEKGYYAASDQEMYAAFDLTYDYDVHHDFEAYIKGEMNLEAYSDVLNKQNEAYKAEDMKLRFVENHDQPRAMSFLSTLDQMMNWTAFKYFEKGGMLIYAGQEALNTNCPSLFDTDPVDWSTMNESYVELLRQLYSLNQKANLDGENYVVKALHDDIIAVENNDYLGLFNLKGYEGVIDTDLPSNDFVNMIDASHVEVKMGKLHTRELPLIIKVK